MKKLSLLLTLPLALVACGQSSSDSSPAIIPVSQMAATEAQAGYYLAQAGDAEVQALAIIPEGAKELGAYTLMTSQEGAISKAEFKYFGSSLISATQISQSPYFKRQPSQLSFEGRSQGRMIAIRDNKAEDKNLLVAVSKEEFLKKVRLASRTAEHFQTGDLYCRNSFGDTCMNLNIPLQQTNLPVDCSVGIGSTNIPVAISDSDDFGVNKNIDILMLDNGDGSIDVQLEVLATPLEIQKHYLLSVQKHPILSFLGLSKDLPKRIAGILLTKVTAKIQKSSEHGQIEISLNQADTEQKLDITNATKESSELTAALSYLKLDGTFGTAPVTVKCEPHKESVIQTLLGK